MGIFIDKHFYVELFVEKKVNYFNKLYKILFDTIWPNSKNFEMFLSSSETSLKIEYAKKIYEDFTLINNTFLPPFTILKVLEDQHKNLKAESSGYVPQDHVIHSIHLYILGIFIFFNSKKLSSKILKPKNTVDNYKSIKDFVLKWQIFSLYHDIGYCFENPEVRGTELDTYKNVYSQIIKLFITKHLSKGLALKVLTENCPMHFDGNFLTHSLAPWYDPSGKKVSKKAIKEQISIFEGAICFDNIANEDQLSQIISMIRDTPYLVSVHNEYGICISLIIRKNFEILNLFSKNLTVLDEILIDNMLDTNNKKYSFKYHFLGIQSTDFWLKIIDDPLVIIDINSQLPVDVLGNITMETGSIQATFFAVNEWIINELSIDSFQEQKIYLDHYSQCLKIGFTEKITQTITTLIEEKKLDNSNVSKYVSDYFAYLQKNKNKVIQEIIESSGKLFNDRYSTTHNINEYFLEQLDIFLKEPFVLEDIKSLEFFTLDGNNVNASPFVHNVKNEFHTELFKLISQKAENFGVTIDLLKDYHAPFVRLDHGVISAALLFQIACFCYDVRDYCLKESKLLLSWDLSYDNKNDFSNFCSECIFAVLLHNIYNKKSAPQYGINYTHNIDKDSFSYFCAFCDTIQKWGRPKKIDLSRTSLPSNNYLEDEFDIDISSENIYIRCIKNNIPQAQALIDMSESFLPGISKLVIIKEFDDKLVNQKMHHNF